MSLIFLSYLGYVVNCKEFWKIIMFILTVTVEVKEHCRIHFVNSSVYSETQSRLKKCKGKIII